MLRMLPTLRVSGEIKRLLIGIALMSVLARLVFFLLMHSEVDSSRWEYLTPDTAHYTEAAKTISEFRSFSSLGVQTFGPGYPLFLAALRSLTCSHYTLMMLIQVAVSVLVSVLMAWWTLQLTRDKRIAWIAGVLNAMSFTAISLANIFLSETLFMALALIGGLVLLHGMQVGKFRYALFAGIFLGIATLTRSMGIAVSVVLLSLCLLGESKARYAGLRIGVVALLVSLAIPIGWNALSRTGDSQMNGAVPSAMSRIVRAVDGLDHDISRTRATASFAIDCLKHADDSTSDFFVSERMLATQRFRRLLADRPGTVGLVLVRNMRDNIANEFGTIAVQIPSLAASYETIRIFNAKKGLNYRVVLIALAGAVLLFVRRQWSVCLVLVLLFCYFAVMSGFSDSQTSRIFYPAQMAWGILVSVTLLAMYDWVMKRWSGRGKRTRH